DIYAYDPVADKNFKSRYPEGNISKGSIHYVNSPQEALQDANICFVFTEWNEIKEVAAGEFKKLMRTPLVYDGRNVFSVREMKEAGVEYYSIGR
ncbi:MAG: UDP-glucose 6-dehydrogenase, partial [Lachnospiraceae bacterium]|nr:UDP-glucose 6-dehydrogenase [Lachnospiraceae bacterium]